MKQVSISYIPGATLIIGKVDYCLKVDEPQKIGNVYIFVYFFGKIVTIYFKVPVYSMLLQVGSVSSSME